LPKVGKGPHAGQRTSALPGTNYQGAREALKRAGVGVIFEEKASGTKRDGCVELQKVLSVLGAGDALVVTRLDRLGRSLRDLANIAHEIEQVAPHLKVLEPKVDTLTAAGRAFFGMLAVFAAFETDVRRERQLEGIATVKRQGVYKGGKVRLDRRRVKRCWSMASGQRRSRERWTSLDRAGTETGGFEYSSFA
jgi:DNA invertase Pin-like site-specific DNA recombinase